MSDQVPIKHWGVLLLFVSIVDSHNYTISEVFKTLLSYQVYLGYLTEVE